MLETLIQKSAPHSPSLVMIPAPGATLLLEKAKADPNLHAAHLALLPVIMDIAATFPNKYSTAAEVHAFGGLDFTIVHTKRVLSSLAEYGVHARSFGTITKYCFIENVTGEEWNNAERQAQQLPTVHEPFPFRATDPVGSLLNEHDTLPQAITELEQALLDLYETLRVSSTSLTATELLSGTPNNLLRTIGTPDLISRGFQWLEASGFPIRHLPYGRWDVSGMAASTAINLNRADWPSEYHAAWDSLAGDTSAKAIGARIQIILEVNNITRRQLASDAPTHTLATWPTGNRAPVGSFLAGALQQWGQALGIEPIFLQTGEFRSNREHQVALTLRGLTISERVKMIRGEAGLSRASVVELSDGILSTDAMLDLERGVSSGFHSKERWQRLGEILNVPPLLLILGTSTIPRDLTGCEFRLWRKSQELRLGDIATEISMTQQRLRQIEALPTPIHPLFHEQFAKVSSALHAAFGRRTHGLYRSKRRDYASGRYKTIRGSAPEDIASSILGDIELSEAARTGNLTLNLFNVWYLQNAPTPEISTAAIRRSFMKLVDKGFLLNVSGEGAREARFSFPESLLPLRWGKW